MTYQISPDIRGLIFDFDGTIVDSMPVHFLSWTEAFASHGCPFPETFFYAQAGVSLEGVVSAYNQQFGCALDPREVVRKKEMVHVQYLSRTPIIPEVVDVIKENFGVRPMAIATGNTRELTLPLLEQLGLTRYFGAVVYGADVARPKPYPDCFLAAAALIQIPPAHCEVFEDGNAGLEGAVAAGMKATDIRPWLTSGTSLHK